MGSAIDKTRAAYKALSRAKDRQELRVVALGEIEAEEHTLHASLAQLLVKKANAVQELQAGETELEELREEIEAGMQRSLIAGAEKVTTPSTSVQKTSKVVPPSDRQLRSRAKKTLGDQAPPTLPLANQVEKTSFKIHIARTKSLKRDRENEKIYSRPAKRSKREDADAMAEKVTQLAAEIQKQYLKTEKKEWLAGANSKAADMGLLRGRIPFGSPVDGAMVSNKMDNKARAALKSGPLQSTKRVMRLP